ncbi:MFS transporter [Yinghuangia aomiensis]
MLSWRWVLFVNVPIALVLALLGPRVLRESRTRKEPLDLPGALTATAGASLLVYGLVNAATHDWGDALTMGPIVGGLVLLALFVVVEARSSDPLMPLSIFSNRNRTGSYIIMFAIGAVLFAMFYFLTLFMQQVAGYSPLKTGLAFLPFAVIVMVLAGVAGQLVGKIGPKPLLMTGTLLAAGALFWFSRLSAEDGYTAQLLGPLLLIGAGVAICFVPLTLAAVAGVHDHEAGISSAVLNTGQQVGGSLGLAVLGTVAAHLTRDRVADLGAAADAHGVGAAYADGYARAFGIAGFVMIAAFLVAALVIRVRKDEIDPEMAGAAI